MLDVACALCPQILKLQLTFSKSKHHRTIFSIFHRRLTVYVRHSLLGPGSEKAAAAPNAKLPSAFTKIFSCSQI